MQTESRQTAEEAQLQQWAKSVGIELHADVHFTAPADCCQRGARAISDIGENEQLVHVPANVLLNKYTCAAPHVVQLVEEALTPNISSSPWLASIATVLLVELIDMQTTADTEQCKFASWLAMLPIVEDLPWRWSHTSLADLEGTEAAAVAREEATSLMREYHNAITHVFADEHVTFGLYTRARTLAASRASSGGDIPCIAPVCDLLNHATFGNEHALLQRTGSDGGSELRMQRACAAGREIMSSYGCLSNTRLLISYGFALLENPNDVVAVDLMHIRAAALSCGHSAPAVKHCLSHMSTHSFPAELLWGSSASSSTVVVPNALWEAASALAHESDYTKVQLLQIALEKRWDAIAGGSLTDDMSALSACHPSDARFKQALIVRVGEKKLLYEAIKQLQQYHHCTPDHRQWSNNVVEDGLDKTAEWALFE